MLVREVMTPRPTMVGVDEPIRSVAMTMADQEIGSVIVSDGTLIQGIVTDRDIATEIVGRGQDVDSAVAGALVHGFVLTIEADDSVEKAMATMKKHAVRRLPVIKGNDLVGIVSQGDLARHADETRVGEMVESISEAPDNTGRL